MGDIFLFSKMLQPLYGLSGERDNYLGPNYLWILLIR